MKTIRGRVRIMMLITSLLALILMCGVTVFSISNIRRDVVDASSTLGSTAGNSSAQALEKQILERLTSTAETKASVADEKLGKQQNYTQMLADYAGGIYENPSSFQPRSVLPPNADTKGTNTAQLLFDDKSQCICGMLP